MFCGNPNRLGGPSVNGSLVNCPWIRVSGTAGLHRVRNIPRISRDERLSRAAA